MYFLTTTGKGICGGQPTTPIFVTNEMTLALAIQNASSTDLFSTIISLRSPLIEITKAWFNISTHAFDVSNKIIEIRCGLNTICILSSKGPNTGIFYGNQAQFSVTSVSFANGGCKDNNYTSCALSEGGALSFLSSVVQLKDCSFVDNFALRGGAIRVSNSELNVIDSYFGGNNASFGGAISSDSSILTIDNTTIRDNIAVTTVGILNSIAAFHLSLNLYLSQFVTDPHFIKHVPIRGEVYI